MTKHQNRASVQAATSRISPSTQSNPPETYCTSGTSPTVHLVGPGQVGRELLGLLAGSGYRLVAVTDSTATILCRDRLDPQRVAAHKSEGGRIADLEGSEALRPEVAIGVIDADLVIDLTPTDVADSASAQARGDAAFRRGARLALASKAALCASTDRWLDSSVRNRIGINAVLGGTGLALREELDELRANAVGASQCGSATTTVIIEAVEAGGTIEDGIAAAREAGVLEPDPELDFRGHDAAVKLALVAGALRGAPIDPATIARPDARELDPRLLRERCARGATTRLVGRVHPSGELTLEFEELPRTSPLVAPWDRLVYTYDLASGEQRVHVGAGVGPRGTAEAVWRDVQDLCPTGGAR